MVRHLRHEQIVKAHELFIDYQCETVYYVMEYLSAITLKKFIKKNLKNRDFFYEEKCCSLV